jgi:tripartite-type tricarboxylate transporter receptor subunit TctC
MTVVPHRTSAEVLTSLSARRYPDRHRVLRRAQTAIDGQQIRAIASSGSKRSPQQPDVPTLRESGIDACGRRLELRWWRRPARRAR